MTSAAGSRSGLGMGHAGKRGRERTELHQEQDAARGVRKGKEVSRGRADTSRPQLPTHVEALVGDG